jgi:transcription elongation factor GreA
MISTATLIDETAKKKKGTVILGSTVIVKDMEFGDEETYTVVGTTEADPSQNRISNESPVGAAILGQKVNTVVQVHTPVGELSYKIVKIK